MSTTPTMTWEQAVEWLRRQSDKTELVQACFYDDPLLDAARRFHACKEWIATRALLPVRPGRALEIGAGRGIASYALATEGWQVTALEPDPSALVGANAIRALSRESGLAIEVVQEWGETLPFSDTSFDLVLCRQVLHHARDLAALCRQIARVLHPGGIMLATREHVISKSEDLPAFLRSHDLHHLYGGENAFLLSDYRNAITAAGLALELTLNPLQSNINLFPQDIEYHRALLARRLRVPTFLIGNWLLARFGERMDEPGRLYSFKARKPGRA